MTFRSGHGGLANLCYSFCCVSLYTMCGAWSRHPTALFPCSRCLSSLAWASAKFSWPGYLPPCLTALPRTLQRLPVISAHIKFKIPAVLPYKSICTRLYMEKQKYIFFWLLMDLSNKAQLLFDSNMACKHKGSAWFCVCFASERKRRFTWIHQCITFDTDWKNKLALALYV